MEFLYRETQLFLKSQNFALYRFFSLAFIENKLLRADPRVSVAFQTNIC